MAETRVFENAIPPHLQTERLIDHQTPKDYVPPFPAYSARFPKEAKGLVMAIIGVQFRGMVDFEDVNYQKLVLLVCMGSEEWKPRYWESASVIDNRGYTNQVVIPYWQTQEAYEKWYQQSGFGAWFDSLKPRSGYGYFLELFLPSIDRFETVFSDNVVPEGAAHMRDGVSGEIQQHVYWGSMRDRLAAAQTDHLVGERAFPKSEAERADQKANTQNRRIRVPGRPNLAIIRSGQDWSNTLPNERKLYLETMHPVLVKGMDFLRDEGEEVGCISNRFMDCMHKTKPGEITERTFGLSYFDDLKSLEGWSKQHKTHLNIFGGFLNYAAELQNNVSLRLFHEVMVLKPEQQRFEYVGCHDTTGMLASL
ncbi:Phenylacetaldoxime dehydratase [Pseudocercospora fuligena]|uniref:Phenylacetaldoxime dehydratase n=1 Tax=Pseudocercospora fuligena TaxID=685502 RepID=A0A8H6REJ7_9PEZI|nr:Phenylacetaldoxime dehydratase [Pseudocercospora fuligena]